MGQNHNFKLKAKCSNILAFLLKNPPMKKEVNLLSPSFMSFRIF